MPRKPHTLRKPAGLSKLALEHWAVIVPELEHHQSLKPIDFGLIAILCEAWARLQASCRIIEREGATYLSSSGLRKRNPAVAVAEAAEKSYRASAAQLGLGNTAKSSRPDLVDDEHNPFA